MRTLDIDTEVAGYLLDPAQSSYVLADLLLRYVGLELRAAEAALVPGTLDFEGAAADLPSDAGRFAVAVARLVPAVTEALGAQGLRDLYDSIERPLVRVLAKMERVGVAVDVDYLQALNDRLAAESTELEQRIQVEAGVEFKVNSTPQLRTVLFDKLGLAPQKKTKTGYSTDAASLEKLRGQHPVVDLLLRYREVEKLRSTYGEGLISEVGPDGRIHATFNQTVARTGRLSSDQPNLHNIPVRTDEGRLFRRAFVPAPGYELLVADYNQIELRVIAHLAEDPGLITAFEERQDIHTATASRVFGVAPGEVRPEQRAKAKMVSYGLAYGMESYGLASRLGIAVPEAQQILDAYFVAFPNVQGLHGADGRRGPVTGLHGDAHGPAPAHPGAVVQQLPHPPGGRAPGHERRHPGPGRRHLQGRPRRARPRPRGAPCHQPDHPPGPRRGDARGTPRGARRDGRPRPPGHGRGRLPVGPDGGQPLVRPQLGRSQVASRTLSREPPPTWLTRQSSPGS